MDDIRGDFLGPPHGTTPAKSPLPWITHDSSLETGDQAFGHKFLSMRKSIMYIITSISFNKKLGLRFAYI